MMIYRFILILFSLLLISSNSLAQHSGGGIIGLTQDCTAGPGGGTQPITCSQLSANSSNNNLKIGLSALSSVSGGTGGNTAIGPNALTSLTTGDSTVSIGYNSGASFLDGRASVFIGYVAGQWAIGGPSNTFIGAFSGRGGYSSGALSPGLSGADNTGVGEASCLLIHGSAQANTCIGFNSLFGLEQGTNNTAVGVGAGQSLVNNSSDSIFGVNAYGFGMGNNNTVVGTLAARGTWTSGTTSGTSNAGQPVLNVADTSVFTVGHTIFSCCTKVGTTILSISAGTPGSLTLSDNLQASVNDGAAVYDITNPHTGTGLVAVGWSALSNVQGTIAPVAVGLNALAALTTGSNNTAIGKSTLTLLTTETGNTAVGSQAGLNIKASNTTCLGSTACQSDSGTPLTGANNTGIGQQALFAVQGAAANNTAVGQGAGAAITTASTSTAVGAGALKTKQTGNNVVAIGYNAGTNVTTGSNSTLIGTSVAGTLQNGNNVIAIGNSVDVPASNTSNYINIGGIFTTTGINTPSTSASSLAGTLAIAGITADTGHTDSTVCQDTTTHQLYSGTGAAGICLGTSSLRFKQDVTPLVRGLDAVMRLEPIAYRYKHGYGGGDNPNKLYGFAAEQVSTVMPELVGLDEAGNPNSVDWAGLVPVLVNAIKEQQREIERIKAKL